MSWSKFLFFPVWCLCFQKLGHCLALLPKSKGDEVSWSLMMQKILVLINDHLNDVFQGMEEGTSWHHCGCTVVCLKKYIINLFTCLAEAKSAKVRRLLVPPGKDPPPPLGGHTSLIGAIEKTIKRSDQLLTSSVSTLMICCCKLLTSSYPVQVFVLEFLALQRYWCGKLNSKYTKSPTTSSNILMNKVSFPRGLMINWLLKITNPRNIWTIKIKFSN